MKNPKAKGSRFEREVAVLLSRWWTGDKRDDIFWRSTSSGARATSRAVKNKTTANSAGDLCYLDSVGESFIKYFSTEIKRGYKFFEIQRAVDRDSKKLSVFEEWIEQAAKSQADANARSWLIIAKKDRAKTLALLPQFEYERIAKESEVIGCRYVSIGGVLGGTDRLNRVLCLPLTDFLRNIDPADVISLIECLQSEVPHIYRLADR